MQRRRNQLASSSNLESRIMLAAAFPGSSLSSTDVSTVAVGTSGAAGESVSTASFAEGAPGEAGESVSIVGETVITSEGTTTVITGNGAVDSSSADIPAVDVPSFDLPSLDFLGRRFF